MKKLLRNFLERITGREALEVKIELLTRERAAAIASWDEERERARREGKRVEELKARLRGLDFYLCDLPATDEDTPWSREDARALAAFLDSELGSKLLKHLTNRLADYEKAAVLYSTGQTAAAACKRAHGFRDCRGELLRLSAAGPSPAKLETPEDALPEDLAHLRA